MTDRIKLDEMLLPQIKIDLMTYATSVNSDQRSLIGFYTSCKHDQSALKILLLNIVDLDQTVRKHGLIWVNPGRICHKVDFKRRR